MINFLAFALVVRLAASCFAGWPAQAAWMLAAIGLHGLGYAVDMVNRKPTSPRKRPTTKRHGA